MTKIPFNSSFAAGISDKVAENGKALLQTYAGKVNLDGAKLTPQLESDVVQISKKAPAILNYKISDDLAYMMQFVPNGEKLFDAQVQEFSKMRTKTVSHLPSTTVKEGDLLHGTYYSKENVEGILKSGIVTGDIKFDGKPFFPEDCETFGCADFFINTKKMSLDEYFGTYLTTQRSVGSFKCFPPEKNRLPVNWAVASDYLPKQRKLCYIVDAEKLVQDAPALFENSVTPSTLEGSKMEGFINCFPGCENHRAVLVGVPSNYISKIVVSHDITQPEIEYIKTLAQKYNLDLKIYNTTGTML